MPPARDPATHVRLAFFRDDRLTALPTRPAYRRAALEIIAERFDRTQRYTEADVNALLAVDGPDHATLRRLLVDHGLLAREAGIYWRQ